MSAALDMLSALLDALRILHFIHLLAPLLWVIGITWVFFLLYAIYCVGYEHWATMPLESKIALGVPVLIGLPLDFLFNLIFGTLIFLELPKYDYSSRAAFFKSETLFTGRVSRWEKLQGTRARIARRICKNLNALQPSHC